MDAAAAQEIILGEGSVKFTFIVVDADGNETDVYKRQRSDRTRS